MIMIIRKEQPSDYHAVENLTREAFWNVYRPGCTEHFVLHCYRSNPDFIPELSLVMEEDGKLIGHVMFSHASLVKSDGTKIPAWTFGPISIAPDYKRKGYGLKLLSHAMAKAKEMGIAMLCMEGNIDFYRHAGFVPASTLGLHYHDTPDAEASFFLACELSPGYLNGVEATYTPPKGYFAADDMPDEFAAYEAGFEPKVKRFMPGQLPQLCQSCGMPIAEENICGTNANGSVNFEYCKFCYDKGEFMPPYTMEGMINHCLKFIDEVNRFMPQPITPEQYSDMLHKLLPRLKRWRNG